MKYGRHGCLRTLRDETQGIHRIFMFHKAENLTRIWGGMDFAMGTGTSQGSISDIFNEAELSSQHRVKLFSLCFISLAGPSCETRHREGILPGSSSSTSPLGHPSNATLTKHNLDFYLCDCWVCRVGTQSSCWSTRAWI